MLRVGLTGGIASGKSHVLRALAQAGLATLDLDLVAHDVTAPGGSAYRDVVAAFGTGVCAPDGTLDRAALGAIVFADPAARARLDAIVHPRVREEEARRAEVLERAGARVLVSDAALLVEAGAHLRFERLIVVHCTPAQQLARLISRDGLPEAAARARIESQLPAAEKRRFAHERIDSSGTPAETDAAAARLAARLVALAAQPHLRRPPDAGRAALALAAGAGPGPRGLSATGLLGLALDSGGLELAALARGLQPRDVSSARARPWYRLAGPGQGPPWPESLAVALALWAASRGHDEEWLCGAAASVCRLTHLEGEAIAGAVLAASAAFCLSRGEALADLQRQLPGRALDAARWGEAPPAPRVAAALAAAAGQPLDTEAVRLRAETAGAEPSFAAGLAALASGSSGRAVPPAIAELARRLGESPAR